MLKEWNCTCIRSCGQPHAPVTRSVGKTPDIHWSRRFEEDKNMCPESNPHTGIIQLVALSLQTELSRHMNGRPQRSAACIVRNDNHFLIRWPGHLHCGCWLTFCWLCKTAPRLSVLLYRWIGIEWMPGVRNVPHYNAFLTRCSEHCRYRESSRWM
jgi:hypothetical protein